MLIDVTSDRRPDDLKPFPGINAERVLQIWGFLAGQPPRSEGSTARFLSGMLRITVGKSNPDCEPKKNMACFQLRIPQLKILWKITLRM